MGYTDEVLADSPSVYWRMGEDSGTTLADEIGSRDLTLSGGYTQNVAGALLAGQDDGAVDFDGSSGKAQHANAGGEFDAIIEATDFAVEFWFMVDVSQAATFVSMRTGITASTCRFSIHPRTSPFNGFQIRGGATITQFSGSTISTGAWHHAVFNYSSGTWTIWLDGASYATNTRAISTTATLLPFTAADDAGTGNELNGKLDELAVYPAVLSEARIAAHYAAQDDRLLTADLATIEVAPFAPAIAQPVTLVADLATVEVVPLTPVSSSPTLLIADLATIELAPLTPSVGSPLAVTADLATIELTSFAAKVGRATAPAGSPTPAYEVYRTDPDNGTPTLVPDAEPEEITWELNRHETAVVKFPKDLASVGTYDLHPWHSDLQIYHDEDILFWGPIVPATASGGEGAVTVECAGPAIYLAKRNVDAERPNRITNPSFEDGTTGWTNSGVDAVTVISTNSYRAGSSVRLSEVSAQQDAFITQSFSEVGTGIGTALEFRGWFFIQSLNDHALDRRGLFVEGLEGGAVQDFDFYPIDVATPQGVWTEASAQLWVPPDRTWTIRVRLYAPQGEILWDALRGVRYESLSTAQPGNVNAKKDVAAITSDIVRSIQLPWRDKSDVNLGRDCPASGVSLTKHYQWADHIRADGAVSEFIEAGYLDWFVTLEPPVRTFRTQSPRRERDKTAIVLAYGGNRVASYVYTEDGNDTESDIFLLGDGNGPARSEAHAQDTSDTAGVVLQGVYVAPPKTTLQALDDQVEDYIATKSRIGRVIELVTVQGGGDLIHELRVGDLVTVSIDDGWVQVSGSWRIVRIVLRCREDSLTLTLNEEVA